MAGCYEQLAVVAEARGEVASAICFWLAAQELRQNSGLALAGLIYTQTDQALAALRTRLGDHVFALAGEAAAQITLEAALERLVANFVPLPREAPAVAAAAADHGLTGREIEVLRQIARGLTDYLL